jgi:hypothetical protein
VLGLRATLLESVAADAPRSARAPQELLEVELPHVIFLHEADLTGRAAASRLRVLGDIATRSRTPHELTRRVENASAADLALPEAMVEALLREREQQQRTIHRLRNELRHGGVHLRELRLRAQVRDTAVPTHRAIVPCSL